ncbi:MAG: thioredoxin [Prevotella sp.]|nr:thioredoxin [Prevotella sp.]
MEVAITSENFESLKNGNLPLVVDLWAPWCGPCRMVGPVISELASQYNGKVVIGKCNVDDEEDIAAELGVRSIPTILFYKNGEVVDKFVGAAPKAVLEEKIKALL